MKLMVVTLLLATAAISAGSPMQNDSPGKTVAAKELTILKLLYKITEPIRERFTELKKASVDFKIDQSLYSDNGKAVQKLHDEIKEERTLPKRHYFSLFNKEHLKDAIMFFEALSTSKSFEVFASTAAYFRELLNEEVFVYGIYTSVIHSEHAHGVVLPPLYEITPHKFVSSKVIGQAYTAKMTQTPGSFPIEASGSQKNPEQRVSYFGEDIGMNVHHVTWHMDYPFWWNKTSHHHALDRKGELFFWVHHQLLVRYDSERLSNNLDLVDELHWDKPIQEGFAPHMKYRYDGEFPSRPDNAKFDDVDGVARIRDLQMFENRIRDAIAHGYIVTKDGDKVDIRDEKGIEKVGDTIESSKEGTNPGYYGALHNIAHIVLGRQGDPHGKYNMPPGVMEHFETATRDPAFFRLHKYMDNLFKEHKYSLPPYTKEDVEFHEVAIEKVTIKPHLETFFEEFKVNLLMAVEDTHQVEDIPISGITTRLNHENFSVEFDITNNNGAEVLATVRVFLCPKEDNNGVPLEFNEESWHCIEIDKFWKKLTAGKNHFERKSIDSSVTVPDIPSYDDLFETAKNILATDETWDSAPYVRSCGIPNRFLIPKGKPQGLDFQLRVVVTDGKKDLEGEYTGEEQHSTHAHCGIHGQKYPDKRPLGFPFDRVISDERIIKNLPTVYEKVVTIVHKGKKE